MKKSPPNRSKYYDLRRPWRLSSDSAIEGWDNLPPEVKDKILSMQGPRYKDPKDETRRILVYDE